MFTSSLFSNPLGPSSPPLTPPTKPKSRPSHSHSRLSKPSSPPPTKTIPNPPAGLNGSYWNDLPSYLDEYETLRNKSAGGGVGGGRGGRAGMGSVVRRARGGFGSGAQNEAIRRQVVAPVFVWKKEWITPPGLPEGTSFKILKWVKTSQKATFDHSTSIIPTDDNDDNDEIDLDAAENDDDNDDNEGSGEENDDDDNENDDDNEEGGEGEGDAMDVDAEPTKATSAAGSQSKPAAEGEKSVAIVPPEALSVNEPVLGDGETPGTITDIKADAGTGADSHDKAEVVDAGETSAGRAPGVVTDTATEDPSSPSVVHTNAITLQPATSNPSQFGTTTHSAPGEMEIIPQSTDADVEVMMDGSGDAEMPLGEGDMVGVQGDGVGEEESGERVEGVGDEEMKGMEEA